MICFASDNSFPVHPKVMEAIAAANLNPVTSYGDDEYTEKAISMFRDLFGDDIYVYFVFTGTGANTIALDALTERRSMILSSKASHISEDECGSPVRFSGCPVRFVNNAQAKVCPEDIEPFIAYKGNVHKSQPDVLSISQTTEAGEVYSLKELDNLSRYCKKKRYKNSY